MKLIRNIAVVLLSGVCITTVQAQVPYILGTWEFDADASQVPGPPPQTHVRSYTLREDGVLVGVAVIVDALGNPSFLQFAANPDGKAYPEFDTGTAAQYLVDGTPPPRTYAEIPKDDPYRVLWIDRLGERVIASGEKWVSQDGQTMSFTVEGTDQLVVFRRTGAGK